MKMGTVYIHTCTCIYCVGVLCTVCITYTSLSILVFTESHYTSSNLLLPHTDTSLCQTTTHPVPTCITYMYLHVHMHFRDHSLVYTVIGIHTGPHTPTEGEGVARGNVRVRNIIIRVIVRRKL